MKNVQYKGNKKARLITLFLILGLISIWIFSLDEFILYFGENWHLEYLPLHSALEIFGTVSAIFMAIVLFLRKDDEDAGKFFWMILGFLIMGILDGFHAIAPVGKGFFLLHNFAGFFGGLCFAFVWLPRAWYRKYILKKKTIFLLACLFSLLIGTYILLFHNAFPEMIHNGQFTNKNITLNFFAGVLFFIAAGKLFLDFFHTNNIEYYLLTYLFMFLGLAKISFTHSAIWHSEWWSWHLLRLCAYILMLYFIVRGYLTILNERKQAEEESKSAYKELNQIFNTAADGMRLVDKDFTVFRVNETFSTLAGVSKDEAVGKKCYEVFHGSLCQTEACPLIRILRGEERVECDSEKERKDGTKINCIVTATPFRGRDGQLLGIVEDFKNITERKQAERELLNYRLHLEELVKERTKALTKANKYLEEEISEREHAQNALKLEQQRLFSLLDGVPGLVLLHAADYSIRFANQYFHEHFGNPEGRPCYEIIHGRKQPCEKCPTFRVFDTKKPLHWEWEGPEGRIFSISDYPFTDIDGTPLVLELGFDITKRKKLAEETVKVQKLESIGILAGGIAHDFNNILVSIVGSFSLLKYYANSKNDKFFQIVERAENAAQRAKGLTKQLLTFSRGGAPIKKTASIAEILRDTAGFALRGANVRCEFFLSDNLWAVEADKEQMSQVINNLIINANQAMPEGGIIRLCAENIVINEENSVPLKKGEYIKISVEDEGVGIPEKYLQKIFDPYFTTKEKGSGLGLATTYSIIKKHDGYITVESQPGVGTRFYIYLPASLKEMSEEKVSEGKVYFGQGRILVLDDEQSVNDTVGDILSHLGYLGVFVKDGDEAIRLYKDAMESGKSFDAVILDLTIPGGLGGDKVIQELHKMDPEVKAIVSSGYSNDIILSHYKEYGFKGLIAKPYRVKELSRVLYFVINGKEKSDTESALPSKHQFIAHSTDPFPD